MYEYTHVHVQYIEHIVWKVINSHRLYHFDTQILKFPCEIKNGARYVGTSLERSWMSLPSLKISNIFSRLFYDFSTKLSKKLST